MLYLRWQPSLISEKEVSRLPWLLLHREIFTGEYQCTSAHHVSRYFLALPNFSTRTRMQVMDFTISVKHAILRRLSNINKKIEFWSIKKQGLFVIHLRGKHGEKQNTFGTSNRILTEQQHIEKHMRKRIVAINENGHGKDITLTQSLAQQEASRGEKKIQNVKHAIGKGGRKKTGQKFTQNRYGIIVQTLGCMQQGIICGERESWHSPMILQIPIGGMPCNIGDMSVLSVKSKMDSLAWYYLWTIGFLYLLRTVLVIFLRIFSHYVMVLMDAIRLRVVEIPSYGSRNGLDQQKQNASLRRFKHFLP